MATITGTTGNDTLTGTTAADTIYGGSGDDTIIDNDAQSDLVYGGAGNDIWLPSNNSSASGSDRVYLEDGNDTAYLGWLTLGRPETIDGGAGSDTFNYSNFPNNAINVTIGSTGTLNFMGTLVSENVYLNFENVVGNSQNNTIIGNQGDNTLDGGNGDDSLNGGAGNDVLLGGQGRDQLVGGDGADTLDGGNDEDSLDGGAGDDTLFGGQGQDRLSGGAGQDQLFGGTGDDSLSGDAGNDSLFGGQGQDQLYGGAGDDVLRGADGPGQDNDDRLFGGAGKDTLYLEDVQDSAFGGLNSDLFVVAKDGNIGVMQVVGGEDPDGSDIDVLDLKTGLLNGDYASVTIVPGANSEAGTAELRDAGGNIIGRVVFTEIEKVLICFTPGTMIATPQGERAVETLRVGDTVMTRDNGIQPIRWVGRRDLSPVELAQQPELCPVRIRAGALPGHLPDRDLVVSPSHRVLISGDQPELLFENTEILVAAKHLTHLDGVDVLRPEGSVSYIHIMFDQHEVILSNAAWTESFQPGAYSLQGIDAAQRQELLQLFPELATDAGLIRYTSARRSLKRHEAALL